MDQLRCRRAHDSLRRFSYSILAIRRVGPHRIGMTPAPVIFMKPYIIILFIAATLLTSGCSLFKLYRGTTKFDREERKASGMSVKEWDNRPRQLSTERIESANGDN